MTIKLRTLTYEEFKAKALEAAQRLIFSNFENGENDCSPSNLIIRVIEEDDFQTFLNDNPEYNGEFDTIGLNYSAFFNGETVPTCFYDEYTQIYKLEKYSDDEPQSYGLINY